MKKIGIFESYPNVPYLLYCKVWYALPAISCTGSGALIIQKICVVCGVVCDEMGSFAMNRHNSTTGRNYWEICILACCSRQGETIGDGFRKPGGVLLDEKAKVRRLGKNYLIHEGIILT
jgi:hypothetical protein